MTTVNRPNPAYYDGYTMFRNESINEFARKIGSASGEQWVLGVDFVVCLNVSADSYDNFTRMFLYSEIEAQSPDKYHELREHLYRYPYTLITTKKLNEFKNEIGLSS